MTTPLSASECEARAEAAHARIDPFKAEKWWRLAAAAHSEKGDLLASARCIVARASALRQQPNFPAAQAAAEEAIALIGAAAQPELLADAKRVLAIALRHRGHDDAALRELDEAVTLYRACGLEDKVALCANSASHILRDRGEHHRAVVELEAAIARVHDLDGEWKSMLFTTLGLARRAAGDREGALMAHEEAVVRARRWGRRDRIASALSNLAASRRLLGDPAVARRMYAEVIDLAEGVPGMKPLLMNTYTNLATVERELGEYDDALAHAHAALAYYRRRRPQRRTSAHVSLGRTYAAMGRHDEALRHYRIAWRYLAERGHVLGAARARFQMGAAIRAQHPDDPRTLRRVLRYWVPAYVELERARFQFPLPSQRRQWQALTVTYRVRLFEVARQLGDAELVADLVESAIHSGAYGPSSEAASDDGDFSGVDEQANDASNETEETTSGDAEGGPAVTLGGGVVAVAGATLPLQPTPPLTAPYGRLRLGRYQAVPPAGHRLGTW